MRGKLISYNEVISGIDEGTIRLGDPLQVDDKRYIEMEEPFVLINHSCDPNCKIFGNNILKSLRDIHPGEELTYNYSTTMYESEEQEPWTMQCACGAKNCLGLIDQFYTLPHELAHSVRCLK